MTSFLFLVSADTARYWLGTHGNLHRQVFHLTAFLFLSLCPLFPCVLYCNFFAEHLIAFDTIVGGIFLVLLLFEVLMAFVVLKGLLRQETSRFVRLREAAREKHKQDAFAAESSSSSGAADADVRRPGSQTTRRSLDGFRGVIDKSVAAR